MHPTTPEHRAWSLVPLQLPHAPDHSLLRVVPHGAGVDQHHVGPRRLVHAYVAFPAQHAEEELRVGHVHLAAVGLDVEALGHGSGVGEGKGNGERGTEER